MDCGQRLDPFHLDARWNLEDDSTSATRMIQRRQATGAPSNSALLSMGEGLSIESGLLDLRQKSIDGLNLGNCLGKSDFNCISSLSSQASPSALATTNALSWPESNPMARNIVTSVAPNRPPAHATKQVLDSRIVSALAQASHDLKEQWRCLLCHRL